MKQLQVKASIGDAVWFMFDNKPRQDKVHSIELYDTCSWYKFYRLNDDYIKRREEDIFLSKEEFIKRIKKFN